MTKTLGELPAGWRWNKLGDILDKPVSGFSVNGEDRPALPGERGVLKLSAVVSGRFLPDQNKAVSDTEANTLSVGVVGDTLLVSRSNTEDLVGAVAYIPHDYPDLFLPDLLWSVKAKPDAEVSLQWLGAALSSSVYRPAIVRQASGTSASMKKLTKPNFLSVQVAFPSLPEQHAVARVFSLWDRVARLTTDLIEAKRLYRKGIAEALLTGRTQFERFKSVKWATPTIGEIAHEVTDRNVVGEDLPVLSCSKYDGLVESLQYFGKQVFSDDTSNYKVVQRGQFAYPSNHIEEGSIGLLECADAGLVSPIYTVFATSERVYPPFLYKVLKTDRYRRIFKNSTSASVDRRGSLRWREFSKIRVPVPSVEEQETISACIGTFDAEIKLLSAQLEQVIAQKQTLMQKLLTGEVRVSLNQEV